MRISDQYVWNFLFVLFFASLVVTGAVILSSEATRPLGEISVLDVVLLSCATLRLTRLIMYDKITAFFREQFYDVVTQKTKRFLEKPIQGPRRTITDLLECPWCVGMWSAATILFFYYLTPYAWFPIVLLALSGIATTVHLLVQLLGLKTEQLKREVEG